VSEREAGERAESEKHKSLANMVIRAAGIRIGDSLRPGGRLDAGQSSPSTFSVDVPRRGKHGTTSMSVAIPYVVMRELVDRQNRQDLPCPVCSPACRSSKVARSRGLQSRQQQRFEAEHDGLCPICEFDLTKRVPRVKGGARAGLPAAPS
jgi:hypothetical protein